MRLKIGLIVPGFSASESDWCIPALLDMVRELALEHEVHVFTLRYPHQRRTYSVYGATVHALGGATISGIGRISLLGQALYQVMREAPFDVLHGLWADEPGFTAVVAGRLLRVPTVVSVLGGELINLPQIGYGHQLSRSARWMIKQSLRLAKQVTVGSELLRFRIPYSTVIPLGVDMALFTPDDEEKTNLVGEIKLLHVASLSPIKNQEMLLRAFALVCDELSGVHLHIIGDGVLRPHLEKIAGKFVTFHGDVNHEKLPTYYRAADLCLLTSHYESQSMVALEAGACGRVTVGTKVGILPELISSEFLANDAEGLANVVIRLIQDTNLRMRLNEQVYRRVAADYSLKASMEKWLAIYLM